MNLNSAVISDREIEAFERDGVICLRGIFDNTWLTRMRVAVDRDMENPGPLSHEANQGGRFLNDNWMWTRDSDFRTFIFESPAVNVAAQILKSEKVNLLNDNLLVKEPGSQTISNWHNDYPYWPIKGWKCCTVWLPLDPITETNGRLEYVKGSHLWDRWLLSQEDNAWLLEQQPLEILSWNLEPGDCLVHHLLTIHYASGNRSSTRRRALATAWAGDDITWDLRANTWFLMSYQGLGIPECNGVKNLKSGETIECELFPRLYPREKN